MTTGRLRRRLDTPEAREFWTAVDRAAAEVATWPAWKRAAGAALFPPPEPEPDIGDYSWWPPSDSAGGR